MKNFLEHPGKCIMTNHWIFPKKVTLHFGNIKKAAYLSFLMNHFIKAEFKDFDVSLEDASTGLGISKTLLRKYKKELIEEGFFTSKLDGFPAKEIFSMNKKKMKEYWKI